MATSANFVIKNGLTVGANNVIAANGVWVGASTNIIGATGATGPVGATGATGATGASGSNGTAGATGATGATGLGYSGLTSTTSTTIGTGSFTFSTNLFATNTAFTVGTRIRISYTTTPTNYMEGVITSFTSQSLVVSVDYTGGSGTFASWSISIAGAVGASGSAGTAGATGATGATGPAGATGTFSSTSFYQMYGLGVGTAAGATGEIRATNAITAYYSDDRLKTRMGNITNPLDKLRTLNGFYYEANELAQSLGYKVKKEVGVSAQEVQKVLPEIVVPAPIDDKYLTVHYERIIPLLIEAIKELEEKLNGNIR